MIQRIHFIQRVGLALLIAVASVASCVGAEPGVAPAPPDRPTIAVILHFNATAAALNDVAHAKTTAGGVNPNRPFGNDFQPEPSDRRLGHARRALIGRRR